MTVQKVSLSLALEDQLCKIEAYVIILHHVNVFNFSGVCPVLCSGHGEYAGGKCHCSEGWKGAECDIPAHDCEPTDCSGRGQCVAGHCNCKPGWKGSKCDEGNLRI